MRQIANLKRCGFDSRPVIQLREAMQNALHFVGFKNDRMHNAMRVFGRPDFWHRLWDWRAVAEVMPGDTVIFANGDQWQPVREFTHDDSQLF